MDDEIHFGEIEQSSAKKSLRPDENRHLAVAPYGSPRPDELPVFVDLDVLRDMDDHALSDMSVELGGVLLGHAAIDRDGRPFVVITDCLRAQHYESTRGSFKFTHDTWSAITRQRQQLAPELQIVGWYHTHPGWGVFLSGMDAFICEHFFNKPLDVAYVIDPCQRDRGMFQWTEAVPRQTHRTGGFFVTTSRFRAAELEYYASEPSLAMSASASHTATGPTPPPIVHFHQPQQASPSWQASAVFAALTIQLFLVALIALRLLAPVPEAVAATDGKVVAALEKLGDAVATIEARRVADLSDLRAKARTEFLDAAFHELKGAEGGAISRLQARFDQTARLSDDVAARDAQIRELRTLINDTREKLITFETAAKKEEARLRSITDALQAENSRLKADLRTKQEALAAVTKKSSSDSAQSEPAGQTEIGRTAWWTLGGLIAIVGVAAAVWWVGSRGHLWLAKAATAAPETDASLAGHPEH